VRRGSGVEGFAPERSRKVVAYAGNGHCTVSCIVTVLFVVVDAVFHPAMHGVCCVAGR